MNHFAWSYFHHQITFVLVIKDWFAFSDLEWFFLPLAPAVWVCCLIFMAFCAVLLFVLRALGQKDRLAIIGYINNRYIYKQILIVLGCPTTYKSQSFGMRTMLLTFLVCFFILRTAYIAKLYDNMKFEVSKDTPDDFYDLIVKKDYKVNTPIGFREFVENIPEISNNLINKDDCSKDICELAFHMKSERKLLTMVPRLSLEGLRNINSSYFDFKVIRKPVFQQSMCMYFQPNSVIAGAFSNVLMNLEAHGFMKRLVKKYTPHNIEHSKRALSESLQFNQVSIVFKMIISVYIGAILLFVVELISVRFKRLFKLIEAFNDF